MFSELFSGLEFACSDLCELTLMGLVGKLPSPTLYIHYLVETPYMHMFHAQSPSPVNFPFSELTKEFYR